MQHDAICHLQRQLMYIEAVSAFLDNVYIFALPEWVCTPNDPGREMLPCAIAFTISPRPALLRIGMRTDKPIYWYESRAFLLTYASRRINNSRL